MERHYESALRSALDELYLNGATSIRHDYLYLWFNAARLGKGAWREIQNSWEELCVSRGYEEAPALRVLSASHALCLFRESFPDEEIVPLKAWT
jgi:hypothetical protein